MASSAFSCLLCRVSGVQLAVVLSIPAGVPHYPGQGLSTPAPLYAYFAALVVVLQLRYMVLGEPAHIWPCPPVRLGRGSGKGYRLYRLMQGASVFFSA
ncbi:hypothetical protein BDV26DRAFT_266201 [Aspergillus bertholletiae]|uniref:Uncharacterized protein n=1 Tax=Aspergillus bertholletiae TaxID=1226010 RepID=A0A5N7B2H1_9EURO|nr:hypothetical protein BDV26DRAFT_266201 [Aspergillus bertholletiae]